LKAYIRIAKTPLPTLIDTEASVCVTSKDLTKKLKLKIEANNRTKVVLLEGKSKIRVISLILNTLITVQNLYTSELLYIIGEIESVIILEIN